MANIWFVCRSGSPPPVWGIPGHRFPPGPRPRFTPTCVGNTSLTRRCGLTTAVHPHLCGEYTVLHQTHPSVSVHPHLCGEYTPSLQRPWSSPAVHPHLCGEYIPGPLQKFAKNGSPPPVWGIRRSARPCSSSDRFTPTCVGNTRERRKTICRISVHPHLCGEYRSIIRKPWFRIGSPPPVWGILAMRCLHAFMPGSPPPVWGIHEQIA